MAPTEHIENLDRDLYRRKSDRNLPITVAFSVADDISHPSGYITPKVYHKFRKEFISLHYEVMLCPEILRLRSG